MPTISLKYLQIYDVPHGATISGDGNGDLAIEEEFLQEEKMYKPENAKEIPAAKPMDATDAVIIEIKDGKVRDFVSEKAKANWKGNLDGQAIEAHFLGKFNGLDVNARKMFTYRDGANGEVEYTAKGDLAKFKVAYGSLPTLNQVIKLEVNAGGFWELKLPQ